MKLATAIFCLIGAVASAPVSAAPSKIVITPIQSSNVEPGTLEILDELLVNLVRGIGKYTVIGKSDIDAMLGLENLKDQLACEDTSCAVEIGGALGADLLLAGKVAQLGGNIILVLKLIDTKAQVVLASVKHKAPNNESLYDQAIEDAGRKILAEQEKAEETPEEEIETGRITVRSSPSGEIFIDGESTGRTTPAILTDLPCGTHEISVRNETASAAERIELEADHALELELELGALSGELEITANEPNAKIHLDGEYVGVAPQIIETTAGPHQIEIRLPGFVPWRSEEMVVAGETRAVRTEISRPSVHRVGVGFIWREAGSYRMVKVDRDFSSSISIPDDAPFDWSSWGSFAAYIGVAEYRWSHRPWLASRVRLGLGADWGDLALFASVGEQVSWELFDNTQYLWGVPDHHIALLAGVDLESMFLADVLHASAMGSVGLRLWWLQIELNAGYRFLGRRWDRWTTTTWDVASEDDCPSPGHYSPARDECYVDFIPAEEELDNWLEIGVSATVNFSF